MGTLSRLYLPNYTPKHPTQSEQIVNNGFRTEVLSCAQEIYVVLTSSCNKMEIDIRGEECTNLKIVFFLVLPTQVSLPRNLRDAVTETAIEKESEII